nr:hypothetical protein [uncultured Pseudomonas sp.]
MTIFTGFVIQRENGDLLWFDAVTQLSRNYSASVSKHPLSNGALITDHTTLDNPQWKVSAVLTDADFNVNRPTNLARLDGLGSFDLGHVSTDENGLYKPQQKQFTNNGAVVPALTISQTGGINKLLPEVIAQFTKDNIPTVEMSSAGKAKIARAVARDIEDMIVSRERFRFVELNDMVVLRSHANCVFTNVSFHEDEHTGEGIWPEMAFEQVAYAQPKTIRVSVANKGRQTGKSKTVKGKTDNTANAPSSYSKASVLN